MVADAWAFAESPCELVARTRTKYVCPPFKPVKMYSVLVGLRTGGIEAGPTTLVQLAPSVEMSILIPVALVALLVQVARMALAERTSNGAMDGAAGSAGGGPEIELISVYRTVCMADYYWPESLPVIAILKLPA